ncbi:hypothetical protein LSH36_7g06000, partial [Paralvinella palmiformis]
KNFGASHRREKRHQGPDGMLLWSSSSRYIACICLVSVIQMAGRPSAVRVPPNLNARDKQGIRISDFVISPCFASTSVPVVSSRVS